MFTKRRARREQERQQELSVRLRSSEAEVRAAAAAEIAQVRDVAWAIRELAQALGREPSPGTFDGVADPFCDALCRDRAARERVEAMFAAHADEPAALVRAWTGLLAEYGAGALLKTVDEELAEDVGGRLGRLHEQGWRYRELVGKRPDSFAYIASFGAAVKVLYGTVRRHTPLTADEADRARREIRTSLERALAHPVNSEARDELLVPLCERPDDESWADRQLAALRIEEALDLCGSTDPDRVALGVEALDIMLHFNDVCLHDAVRGTLDRLCTPDQEPFTFSEALSCYSALHSDRPLADPPVETFLAALGHTDPLVRANAAAGLDTIAPGLPQESRAVAALIKAVDHDPDVEVVRSAAYALATIVCTEEANTRAASAALARQADSADPSMRLASVEGAIGRDEPGGYDRLSAELRRPDVEARFVSAVGYFCEFEKGLPQDVNASWTRLLDGLRQDGWADRPNEHEDGDDTDPDFRRFLLDRTLESLHARA